MTDGKKKKTVGNWRTGGGGGIEPITCDATVPLPAILFQPRIAGAPDVSPLAFRILIGLIWQAWEGIGTDPGQRHLISVAVLGEYAVVGAHAGTDYLRKGLRELVAAGFATMVDGTKGAPIVLDLPPDLSVKGGVIEFTLTDEGIAEFGLRKPGTKFVRVWLAALRLMPSIFAVRLYLLLAQYGNRKKNGFTTTPKALADDLRIPVTSSYRRNFRALEVAVLRPTRDVVDFCTDMAISYVPQQTSPGAPVLAIEFSADTGGYPNPLRSVELVAQTLANGPGRKGGPPGAMPLNVALLLHGPLEGETFGMHLRRVKSALAKIAVQETADGTESRS